MFFGFATQTENAKLWQFSVALYAVMALGFPVAISAVSVLVCLRIGLMSSNNVRTV